MSKTSAAGAAAVAAIFLSACGKRGEWVARVGSETISTEEFHEALSRQSPALQSFLNTPEGRQTFLDTYLRRKIMVAAARREKLDRSQEIQAEMRRLRSEMERELKRAEEDALLQAMVEKLRAGPIAVSEAEVEAAYKSRRAEFLKPREVELSHILFPDSASAQTAYARLGKGESFSKLARELSQDPVTAEKGGAMGTEEKPFVSRGELPSELETVVFSLKRGEISKPVRSQFGYHIFKLTGERTVEPIRAEDAKLQIRRELERKKFDEWLAQIRPRLRVKINTAALGAVPPSGGRPGSGD